MKVTEKGFWLDVGKFSFSNRVVNEWNVTEWSNYPEQIVGRFYEKDWLSSRIHQGIYISSIWASFLLFVEIIIIILNKSTMLKFNIRSRVKKKKIST